MAYLPSLDRTICLCFSGVPITGAPLPSDRASLSIPPYVQRWVPSKVECYYDPVYSGASLAGASIAIFSNTGGLGKPLLSTYPVPLSSMTVTGTYQNFTLTGFTTVYTSTGITIRQVDPPVGNVGGFLGFNVYIDVLG